MSEHTDLDIEEITVHVEPYLAETKVRDQLADELLGHRYVCEQLGETGLKLATFDLLDKEGGPASRFRATIVDPDTGRQAVAHGQVGVLDEVTVSPSAIRPVPTDDEFDQAIELALRDEKFAELTQGTDVQVYRPMPPNADVTNPDGTRRAGSHHRTTRQHRRSATSDAESMTADSCCSAKRRSVALIACVALLFVGACTTSTGGTGSLATASDAVNAPTDTHTATAPPATTPAPTTSGLMTGQELLWLQAVEQLPTKMNKVFDSSPTHITSSALASMAYQLRGCSRELSRIGSPTVRLQPVSVLVHQACRAYDKGAQCLQDAARIVDGISSPAQEEAVRQKLDCGFAASGDGGEPLVQALIKADKIKAAAH